MKSAFIFITVYFVCLITSNKFIHFDSNNMFLELVSIIVIFFSSLLLLYRVSRAPSRKPRVRKLRWRHVALNIAAVNDYGIPLSPFLS